jgi:ketosteroid isomerase-like protein
VRSIYADWERGDFSRTDWADPEIEFVMADGPDPGKWMGVGAMAEAWRAQMSVSEDYRVEADKHRELDSDRVLVLIQHSGRAKASGLEVEQLKREGANVFDLRDGKVTRLALYWNRDHALADLGLEQ